MKRVSPGILFLLLTASWLVSAHAAIPEKIVDVDLAPLIDRSARFSDRFAVSVPHAASAADEGAWSGSGTTRTWSYQVRVPTAVSLSFHASQVRLPPSAQLTVTGLNASVTYDANDARGGALWGRPLVGDTLTFLLSVSAKESSAVRFEIASLQAGYRGLSRDVPDHPRYKQLNAAANAAVAACTQNYACNTTDANRGPGKATVALLIGNVAQCTGTLVNNTRSDGRPFVLTARHCQNGELGGGSPDVASSVTIYWDSLTPCGQVLGSLYGNAAQVQSGATTRVEQQDTWLIELDQPPRIAEPYFAGWDATGGVFTGGYSIHHALGNTKQYVTWNGQAILQRIPGSLLSAPYESDFWGVVNSLGNVGAGASGGALFDPGHRVVGTASLALISNAGEGSCPVAQPPAPNASNISAQYTALSAIWSSTRDASSATGTTTLQTVLDPDATGRLIADGFGIQPVTLTVSNGSPRTDGPPVTLSWNAAWAQSCTATGGRSGDGWAGAKGASGSAQVMDYDGGAVQYTLACTGPGSGGRANVQVDWNYIAPSIWLAGPSRPVMLGSPVELRWESNVSPCTGGDGAPGDGWAGAHSQSGTQMVTPTQTGLTSYSLSCGSGRRVAAAQVTAQVVIPAVTLRADATRARVGTWVQLFWASSADGGRCDAADGVPGWVQNNQFVQSTGGAQSTSDVPGTITYTINCTVGPYSSSASVAVEFVDEPPSVTLTALFPTQEIRSSLSPLPEVPNLAWTSNMSFCFMSSRGPFGMGNKQVTMFGLYPAGTAVASEHIAGTYEYVLGCGGLEARTSIVWLATNPTVTLTTDSQIPGTWVAGRDYSIWSTSNTLPCATSGGASGDGWVGATDIAPNYSRTVTAPRVPGTYTYTMTCGIGTASVGSKDLVITVAPPAVTLTVAPASPAAGQYVTVSWKSTTSPCSANADGAGVNWASSNMNESSSVLNKQDLPGTYTYTITCGAGAHTATASTQVTFRSGPATEFTASATTVAVNTPVTLTWVSGTTIDCGAIGGVIGDGWAGAKPVSGSATVTSSVPQTVNYGLNCNGGNGRIVSVTYTGVSNAAPTVPVPAVTLTASSATRTVGESATLTWSSQNTTACAASGGVAGDGWSGSLSLSGTTSVTRASPGASDYTINCTGAIGVATAQITITFNAAAGSASGSSGGASAGGGGGGGGGGALDRYFVLALLLALWARSWRRSREGAFVRQARVVPGLREL